MTKDEEESGSISALPTEIILYVFKFLTAKQIFFCRSVCQRWKQIIDALCWPDKFWEKHCLVEYKDISKSAKYKSHKSLQWYNIYKSLTLWSKLAEANEDKDEFAAAERVSNEILSFVLLRDGIIGVHKSESIVYYDSETLESTHNIIRGSYYKYAENDYIVAGQNTQLNMLVLRKNIHSPLQEKDVVFDNVKTFILVDRLVYYITLRDEIFICNTENEKISNVFIKRSGEHIIGIGYTDCLNVLTNDCNIFMVIGDSLVFKCTLGPNTNILHYISQCNLFEEFNWRVYLLWLSRYNLSIDDLFFNHVITIKQYGKVFLLGSNYGLLRIYYDPYTNGELDLLSAIHVKEYNLARSHIPILADCPIIKIDIVENENGHTVYVAMPKKIVTLKLTHELPCS